ncbi:hypothetical protein A3Q56_04240 [Intoshia linei]|uniref:TLDc domain-containing protein n=1 Tax=Intoshia linei TaxID=1819745 RepID=A0A177B2S1_9BILA|nr:hypothetical protein A3Q56_04240 [Intoshia linei]
MEDFLNYTDAAKSHILTLEMWNNLYNTFIATVKIKLPILLFSSRDDGFSFLTFYRKVANYTYTILLVSTSDSQIFGALCSQDWNKRIPTNKRKFSYFGNGETFVFKMTENKMSVYGWTEKKKDGVDSFIYGDDTTIIVGGGTTGAIRFVNGDLSKGYTAHSETFGNEPLITSSTEISEFTTGILECYGMS